MRFRPALGAARVRLSGRSAVVTGAAAGIGEALAVGLAGEGARVMCADVDGDGASRVAGAITGTGGEAIAFPCDVTDIEQVEAMLGGAVESFGKVDVLAANAGGTGDGPVPFLELDANTWHAMMALNLHGAFYCGLVFGRHMAANGRGSIIFTSSQLSVVARRGMAHYSAAKGAIGQLVRGMAIDLGGYGVRVNAIAPGPTMTERMRPLQELPAVREENLRNSLLGRIAQPSEMAGAVVYLASDESSFTTGTTIFVDGGYTAL